MTDAPPTDDGRTDGGTDVLDDSPSYAERVEEHREGLTEIAAGGAPDAHVARILLARAEGRDPDPADLTRLMGGDTRQGEIGPDAFRSPSDRFERGAERVFEQVSVGDADRGGE